MIQKLKIHASRIKQTCILNEEEIIFTIGSF